MRNSALRKTVRNVVDHASICGSEKRSLKRFHQDSLSTVDAPASLF